MKELHEYLEEQRKRLRDLEKENGFRILRPWPGVMRLETIREK